RSFLPADVVSRTLNPLAFDVRAVAAAAAVAFVAVLIAGMAPAWLGTRQDASLLANLATRSTAGERQSRRATTWLLVAEFALAVALCVAAGVQLRCFVNLLH